MIYTTKAFWQGAGERALRTGAQMTLIVAGAGITASGLDGETAQVISAFTLDWVVIGGTFLGGAFTSVMTSIASPNVVPVIEKGTGKRVAR